MYLVLLLGATVLLGLGRTVGVEDFWFHTATGRVIVTEQRIPTVDTYSFTQAGEPFFNQGWLAQLAFYLQHEFGGLELVLLIHALVITAAFAVLVLLCREVGASKRLTAAALGLVALPLSVENFGVRPQAYVYVLFALALWCVWGARHRARTGPTVRTKRLWMLPLIVAVWANVHGSFPLALALVVAVLVGDATARRLGQPAPAAAFDRRLAAAGAAAALATVVHPGGWRVWGYVLELTTNSAVTRFVAEWQTPTLRDATGLAFFAALFALGGALATTRHRMEPAPALLALGFAVLGVSAIRNVVWFGLVAAVLLAGALSGRLPDRERSGAGRPLANLTLVVVIAALVVLALPWVRPHLGVSRLAPLHNPYTPIAAAEALNQLDEAPHRLFNELGYGSYLIWARPDHQVFVDPRFELYPPELLNDYQVLSAGYDADRLLAEYAIDGVLADAERQAGLVTHLRAADGWRVAYEDDISVLFLPMIE